MLVDVPVLALTPEAEALADALLREVPLPPRAATDALHIAVAAMTGVSYLMTWNCTHIANATLRPRIEAACRDAGYEPPVISTPRELSGGEDGSMNGGEIPAELRAWRDEFARSHRHDLAAMAAALRTLDGLAGARVVRGEPRRPAVVPSHEAGGWPGSSESQA